ncbi:MAG: hypothetical protein GY861_17875 [bacterium]|nr:hypothetical protein [bacterium]
MAAFKYDVESLLIDVKKIFRDNLNDKIDCINTEKTTITPETDDDFSISRISTSAWYMNHIPTVHSYPQFVCWGLRDIDLEQNQFDGAKQNVTIFIEVVIPDRGEQLKESTIFQLLRYTRALQDIALENFDKIRGYGNIQVDSLSPTLVDISGKMLRMSGINITASIGIR